MVSAFFNQANGLVEGSLVWYSADGETWDEGHIVGEKGWPMWSAEWRSNGTLLTTAYGPVGREHWSARLYKSLDGKTFSVVTAFDFGKRSTSEAALLGQV